VWCLVSTETTLLRQVRHLSDRGRTIWRSTTC